MRTDDHTLRYEPDDADYEFTFPRSPAQPYIHVWQAGMAGYGNPVTELHSMKWDWREQAFTTSNGHSDFVQRCEEWMLVKGRRLRQQWTLTADIAAWSLRWRAVEAGCPLFPGVTRDGRWTSVTFGGPNPPPWMRALGERLSAEGVEFTLT